jgi:ribosomal protein L7Ae-like RNA K-turn-binding protein
MNEQKIINLLGLAQRAGKLVSGDFAVQKAIQTGQVKLLLIAADAAEKTKQHYLALAKEQQLSLYLLLTRETLGHCIGKDFRAIVAVLDDGFSQAIGKWFANDEDC